VGMQNGTATLEINLAVPYIDKHTLAIFYHTYNPEMPLCIYTNKSLRQYKDLYSNAHRNLTQNSPKLEAT